MKSPRSYSDLEIARYVLGLNLPEQARNIQKRLACDDAAAACALKWEAYFLDIVDALPPAPVPDTLLARIQNTLGMEDLTVLDEIHPRTDTPHAVVKPPSTPPAQQRDPRSGRLKRGRVVVVAGVCIGIFVIALTLWANLRPIPSSLVQEPVILQTD